MEIDRTGRAQLFKEIIKASGSFYLPVFIFLSVWSFSSWLQDNCWLSRHQSQCPDKKREEGGEIQREKSTARDVLGFPGSSVVKNSPAMQETRCLIPGSERPPGVGHGSPIQYSCLENPMDRGAWRDTVHGVTKSRTWLKRLSKDPEMLCHFIQEGKSSSGISITRTHPMDTPSCKEYQKV